MASVKAASSLRYLHLSNRRFAANASFIPHVRSYAQQSYGAGAGDPKGENPQEQGPSSSASSSQEHPGPPPPKVSDSSSSSSTRDAQDAKGSGSGLGSPPGPKIHNHNAPSEQDGYSAEVRQHNEEMKRRHDRPIEKSGDEEEKVDKGFWGGQGGKDGNP